MRFISLSVLTVVVCCAFAAFAAGGGGDAAESGAPQLTKDQKEYLEKTARLTSLGNRIESGEKSFMELVRKKAAAKSPEDKQGIIRSMTETHEQLSKDITAYNALKSEIRLRFPHQGEQLNRRYQTRTRKSMEELEGAAGLDELLTHVKKVIAQKFAPFNDPKEEAAAQKAAQKPAPVDEAPRLRLEK